MRVGVILVMGAVALLQLVEAEETLPFSARLGVRRVRSKATSKPFTINWANLSNKKSPRKEKQIQKFPFLQVTPNPLSSSYLPPPEMDPTLSVSVKTAS